MLTSHMLQYFYIMHRPQHFKNTILLKTVNFSIIHILCGYISKTTYGLDSQTVVNLDVWHNSFQLQYTLLISEKHHYL